MDEVQYELRCGDFDEEVRKVELAIRRYTADEIVDYEEDIKTPLSDIESRYVALQDKILDFQKEFDREAHPDWVQAWDEKLLALEERYKKNAKAIKMRVKVLKEESRATIVTDPVREGKEKKEIEGKAQVRREYILEAIKELKNNVKKPGSVAKLEDFDVIRYLKESRKWLNELREIDRKVYDLKELVVMYPLCESTNYMFLQTIVGS